MSALELIQSWLAALDEITIGGLSTEKILISAAIFIFGGIFFKFWKTKVLANLKKLARKTATDLDDTLVEVLDEVPNYFYWMVAAFIGFYFLGVENELAHKIVNGIFIVFVIFRLIAIIQKFTNYTFFKMWGGENGKIADEKETALHGIKIVTNILLWSIGLLLILSNLGFEIGTLAASLGIGGVAIAFALQNILGDLFSSFAIYFDKPFQIGDFVVIGADSGTVKKIGMKTTRITTLQGEELVVSNAELTSSRIHNFTKLRTRRVVFGFGVIYSTPLAKLKKIPEIIKNIVEKVELADLDRVHFREFGDSSLNFEVVYYVKSQDYYKYVDTQQEINFAIVAEFEKAKIEMAFPTRTIHIAK